MSRPSPISSPLSPHALAALVALVASGCGGGSGGGEGDDGIGGTLPPPTVIGEGPSPEPPGPVVPPGPAPPPETRDGTEPFTVGLVVLAEAPQGSFAGGGVSGTFFEVAGLDPSFDRETAIREAVDDFDVMLDVCEVDVEEPDAEEDEDDRAVRFVSAGENLILSSPDGGTWRTVPRVVFGGLPLYRTETPVLAGSVPRRLVLDLPGDEFPTFANVPFAEVTPLGEVATDTQLRMLFSTYTWAAADDASSHVRITMERTRDGVTTSITCLARDDGEFNPLSAIDPANRPDGLTSFGGVQVSREAFTVVRGADAVLVLGRSSFGN